MKRLESEFAAKVSEGVQNLVSDKSTRMTQNPSKPSWAVAHTITIENQGGCTAHAVLELEMSVIVPAHKGLN